jgi:hypothetical protein
VRLGRFQNTRGSTRRETYARRCQTRLVPIFLASAERESCAAEIRDKLQLIGGGGGGVSSAAAFLNLLPILSRPEIARQRQDLRNYHRELIGGTALWTWPNGEANDPNKFKGAESAQVHHSLSLNSPDANKSPDLRSLQVINRNNHQRAREKGYREMTLSPR